jgi:beta-carotene ketolase (CrtW type)
MKKYPLVADDHKKGILVATLVIVLWAINLIYLLQVEVSPEKWNLLPQFLLQILLYTGLFITAHDAMHGLVGFRNPKLNNFIGQLALTLFALFSLQKMLPKHKKHHTHPASNEDPDYHSDDNSSLVAWYSKFFLGYTSWMQIISLVVLFNIMHHLLGIELINLILFWALPSILSSMQLFYFGTYLPHRDGSPKFVDEHRARSNDYPEWLSFLTCYHFGYHHEHHLYPWVPWWKLPKVRREMKD